MKSDAVELDAATWNAASDRYDWLRFGCWRWLWRAALVLALPPLIFLLVFELVGLQLVPAVPAMVPFLNGLGFAWRNGWYIWIVSATFALIALRGFRCPLCGKRFVRKGWSSWPTDRCKHCGLDLATPPCEGAKELINGGRVVDWSE